MKKNILLSSLLAVGLLGNSLYASDDLCKANNLTVSIEKGSKLSETLTNVADSCRYSIVYSSPQTAMEVEKVKLYSINIYDKNIDDMLDILLHKNNFNYTIEDNVVTVSKVITKTFRVDFLDMIRKGTSNANISISASESGSGSGGGSSDTGTSGATIDTQEEVDFWSTIEKNITNLVVRPEDKEKLDVSPIINRKSGLITVSGTYNQLKRVENYLDTLLKTTQKQVLIDVKVIAVDLNKNHTTGVDWSKFSLGMNYSREAGRTNYENVNVNGDTIYSATLTPATDIVNSSLSVVQSVGNAAVTLEGMVNFLNSYGDSKTMASPKVLAMNNQPTIISVGDNINYLIKSSSSTATAGGAVGGESELPASLFVGVLLDITPHIDKNNRITLKINPSISELKYAEDGVRQTVARNLPPDTTTRRISTVINMQDGQTFVLGGLINQKLGDNKNSVDGLSSIPLLGSLFKSSEKSVQNTELVFIITAKLVDRDHPLTVPQSGFKLTDKAYNTEHGDILTNKELADKKLKELEKAKKEEFKAKQKIKEDIKKEKKVSQKSTDLVNENSPFYDFQ